MKADVFDYIECFLIIRNVGTDDRAGGGALWSSEWWHLPGRASNQNRCASEPPRLLLIHPA